VGVGGWTRPKASKTATAPRQNEDERRRTDKTCGERKQQSQCSRNVSGNEMHINLTLVQQRRRPIEAAGFGGRGIVSECSVVMVEDPVARPTSGERDTGGGGWSFAALTKNSLLFLGNGACAG
jgi:hypothetical protein